MAFNTFERIIDKMKPLEVDGSYFKIRFGYGTKLDLIRFLEAADKEINNKKSIVTIEDNIEVINGKYPLIWLITPFKTSDSHTYYNIETKPVFMLANVNADYHMTNKERNQRNLKLVLNPLFKEFKKALVQDPAVKVSNKHFEPTTHFNFAVTADTNESGVDKKSSNEVWDALEVSTDLKINNRCDFSNCNC